MPSTNCLPFAVTVTEPLGTLNAPIGMPPEFSDLKYPFKKYLSLLKI